MFRWYPKHGGSIIQNAQGLLALYQTTPQKSFSASNKINKLKGARIVFLWHAHVYKMFISAFTRV